MKARPSIKIPLLLAAALATCLTARAAVVDLTSSVLDPSFESPVVSGGAGAFIITGAPEGWLKGNDVGVHRVGENSAPTTGSAGSQLAFLGNGTSFTNMYQDIGSVAIYGDPNVTSYTFTIAIARRDFGFEATNGSFVIGIHDLNSGAPVTTTISRSALSTSTFLDFSVTLPAATVVSGDILRLFVDKSAGNSLIVVDNVRFTANTVPEPGAALLGLLGGFAAWRRRR